MTEAQKYIEEVLDGTLTTNKWVKPRANVTLTTWSTDTSVASTSTRGGQRFVAFFENFLHHSKGKWSGQLHPVALAAVHLLLVWMETRRRHAPLQTLFCAVGRKNGKSAICSGLGLAMLDFDGEPATRSTSRPPRGTRRASAWKRSGW